MIHFFTDFGWAGPYIGQMHAATLRHANGIQVVDLMHDAPRQDPRAATYLLAALGRHMAAGDFCVGVVDPGVGTDRAPIVMKADGRFFVGPDNGLFEIPARRSDTVETYRIIWRPDDLSASFHGRDLFAPVAGMLAARLASNPARLDWADALLEPWSSPGNATHWPDDLDEVVFIDDFGNCILGRRAATIPADAAIYAGGNMLCPARTFGDVPEGTGIWYENSMGLAEIAVNRGSAAVSLNLSVGTAVAVR